MNAIKHLTDPLGQRVKSGKSMKGTHPIQIAGQADLQAFNGLVLACQDEAFTLAYSILGDEGLACEVVQAVFLRVYIRRGAGGHPIPVQVLQGVIGMCRRARPSKAYAVVELMAGWHQLECAEKEALLLVDLLGKSYQQTALVLDKSEHAVAATVALGRYKLTRSFNPENIPGRGEST
jgi:DNA-directed RNA polymerase specialized sigma24 family protein